MDPKPQVIVESTAVIAQYWNDFSVGYSKIMAPNFEGIGLTLFNLIEAGKADVILEIGCGEGTISINSCLSKKAGARLICSDIAVNMCKIAFSRFEKLSQLVAAGTILGLKQKLSQDVDLATVPWDGTKGAKWDNLGVELYEADNENLRSILPEDNCVDCLMASLSLHLVNDPTKMLSESFRVLRPGKSAVFTVWGNRKQSSHMDIWETAEEKFGSQTINQERSPFYLNNRETSIKLLEDAGFVDVLAWEEMTAFATMSESAVERILDKYASRISEKGTEKYDQALAYMKAERQRILKEEKLPIGLSILILRGTKPAS